MKILKSKITKALNNCKFKMEDEPFVSLILDSGDTSVIMEHIGLKLKYIAEREALKEYHLKHFNKFKADCEHNTQNKEIDECIKVLAALRCSR